MSEPMPSIPTQSTFTYPNPNPSASPSFTQDDTSDSFIPEPTQPIPSFTQTAFSQPVFSQPNTYIIKSVLTFNRLTYSDSTVTLNNVYKGNSQQRLEQDRERKLPIVHPPVSLDEHVAVQRENKVRTLLLQALPEDHMPDFHHYDDARDRDSEPVEYKYMQDQTLLTINLKLWSLKAAAAPTHSCFYWAASSRSKSTYSDQQNIVSSVSQTSGRSET
ncbi:hypothetical protein Tco_0729502 [Tanacetum coccineum]|uniref:Uncharacterized protein n=1 Tax=Tanacetum coccineum TaxID=301880 RepID=A0ABQ4YRG4_9ASTR